MLALDGMSGAEMRHVARLLRKAEARELSREVRAAKRDAVRPLQAEIKAEAVRTLPSGYGPTMGKDVKVSAQARTPTTLSVRIFARGKAELRDVRAVNAGTLRHMLFGNRRRWFTQRVRPGFVDRPLNDMADRVLDEAAEGVGRVLQRIART